MAPTERPDRLYRLLGVADPSLPAEEIYRQFQNTELRLRQQYLDAYRILSNAELKRMYDIFGERMVEFLNHAAWSVVVKKLGTTAVAWLYAILSIIIVTLPGLFFILLAVRIDDLANISFVQVFAPLISLLCVISFFYIFTMFLAVCGWGSHTARIRSLNYALIIAGYFVGLVISAVQLDSNLNILYTLIFIAFMVAEALRTLDGFFWRYPSRVQQAYLPYLLHYDGAEGLPIIGFRRRLISYSFFILTLVDFVASELGWIFAGIRIDNIVDWSWYIIAIPWTVRAFVYPFWSLFYFEYARCVGQETVFVQFLVLLRQMFYTSAIIVTLWLVAFFLEGGSVQVTLAYTFIPIFAAILTLLVTVVISSVFFIMRNKNMLELECEEIRHHVKLAGMGHEPHSSTMESVNKPMATYRTEYESFPFGGSQINPQDSIESINRQRAVHIFNLSDSELSEDTVVEVEARNYENIDDAPSDSQLSDLSMFRRPRDY